MNRLEEYFVETIEMLDDIGIDYFIHGSTLLGKIRNNCLLNRENVLHDKELNFGILAKDYTREFYIKLKSRNRYFNCLNSDLPTILTFFGPKHLNDDQNIWGTEAFSLIATFWETKANYIEYMGNNIVLNWDKKHLKDKSKWETVEILGKKVKTPAYKEEWLSTYFGEDYMTEHKNWHYATNSLNKTSNIKKLIKERKIWL